MAQKIPQYITRIAAEINSSVWLSDEAVAEQLAAIKKAILKGRFYVGVVRASGHGDSYKMTLAYLDNNYLFWIQNKDILKLAGMSGKGVLHNPSMNACASVQYNLFEKLCIHHNYIDDMPRYRSLVNPL